ncbi:acyltransferase [Mariniblastus sp.]|nr:acyltransferase [Mariniblastus sp.]
MKLPQNAGPTLTRKLPMNKTGTAISQSKIFEFSYCPEIDGLRAIAVLLVICAHAELGFTGGFVGVDIFFVISGFLITGLIVKKTQADTFSLGNFWLRRIKRILPAASLVVLTVLVVGAFCFLPQDYVDLANSAIYQKFMLSNVFFWREVDYFAGPAEVNPLLHTLSLEEQFYLGFPLLIVLTIRKNLMLTIASLVVITVSSICLSEWGMNRAPTATFYLLPPRMWELTLGGLIVFLPKPQAVPQIAKELLSIFGLCMIFSAACLFSVNTRFPGFTAIIPCFGAVFFIFSNAGSLTQTGKLIAAKPFVTIGLISYSLYLWHWPILAFGRYWLGLELPLVARACAVLLSFILAWLSWKYVEVPMRNKTNFAGLKLTFIGALSSIILIASLSFLININDGFPSRWPNNIQRLAMKSEGFENHIRIGNNEVALNKFPTIGKTEFSNNGKRIFLWGDSHAGVCVDALSQIMNKNNASGWAAARGGHPPLLGVWSPQKWWLLNSRKDDLVRSESIFKFIVDKEVTDVLLVDRWSFYTLGHPDGRLDGLVIDENSSSVSRLDSQRAFRNGIKTTCERLIEEGKNVYIMLQVPRQQVSPRRNVILNKLFDTSSHGVTIAEHRERQILANKLIIEVANNFDDVFILDPSPFCFDKNGQSILEDSQNLLYNDDNHLSPAGAKKFLTELLSSICATDNSSPNESVDSSK